MASVKEPKSCGCKGVRSCLVCENTDIVNGMVLGNGLTPVIVFVSDFKCFHSQTNVTPFFGF